MKNLCRAGLVLFLFACAAEDSPPLSVDIEGPPDQVYEEVGEEEGGSIVVEVCWEIEPGDCPETEGAQRRLSP